MGGLCRALGVVVVVVVIGTAGALAPERRPAMSRRSLFGGCVAGAGGVAVVVPPVVAAPAPPSYCDEAVAWLSNGATDVFIVGTAHVSNVSAELVKRAIDEVDPELIMLELDRKRVGQVASVAAAAAAAPPPAAAARPGEAPHRAWWAPFSPADVARRAGGLVVGKALSAMYSSLEKLGLDTGAEFAVALEKAAARRTPVLLADRDVDATLDRLAEALRATPPGALARLEALLGAAMVDDDGDDDQLLPANFGDMKDASAVAASVELIKRRATVRKIVAALDQAVPDLYSALVAERDAVMSNKLLAVLESPRPPNRVVAVVGMAHEDGIASRLQRKGFRLMVPSRLQCPVLAAS